MSWFKRLLTSKVKATGVKKGVPEGIWTKCEGCGATLYRAELERNLYVCPKCGQHMRLTARQRLERFLDSGAVEEIASEIVPTDSLRFRDRKKYKERIAKAQSATNENSALLAMKGSVHGLPVVAVAFNFAFIGGSMGAAVGEKFSLAVEESLKNRLPLLCFAASGGARMQEGLIALMQMAKTSAALSKLAAQAVPYISILTNPTTGGVSASLAMLGDIIIAEPKAVIGFAGRRVIEQTVHQQLPAGFQLSEFLLQHGSVDMVVPRPELKATIAKLIAKLTNQPQPSIE